MTQEGRLDKIKKYLTPKRTVIHWLQEIKEYCNCTEYLDFLRSQPEALDCLGDEKTARELAEKYI